MASFDLETAYDVYGDEATCDCGGTMMFDSNSNSYVCPDCGASRDRQLFADMAGLDIDEHCLSCGNNYPACKTGCSYWEEKEFGWS